MKSASADPAADAERLAAIADLLKRGGRQFESIIKGTSMGATLPDGARIRIKAADQTRYQNGQIVAYLRGTTLVAHRIVYCGHGRRRNFILTQGDAWLVCDPPISADAVVGLVEILQNELEWKIPNAQTPRRGWRRWVAALSVGCTSAILAWNVRIATTFTELILRMPGNAHRLRDQVTSIKS